MRRAPVAGALVVLATIAAIVLLGGSAAAIGGSPTDTAPALDDGRDAAVLQDDGGDATTDPDDGGDADDGDPSDGGAEAGGTDENHTDATATTAEQRAAIASGERLVEPCAASSPPDHSPPTSDVIGWESGYWYDQPIVVDDPDALDPAERHAIYARAAARVEALRCQEFASLPPVELVNASELAARQTRALQNRSAAAERFDDARLATSLVVGTEVDPTAARAATRAAAVRATYDPETRSIALYVPEEDGVRLDEVTLAHELVHALQDQAHDLSRFDAQLTDAHLAESGLIEGDAGLVERRYERRCGQGGWNDTCLRAPAPDGDGDASTALNLVLYQPYNDGPDFVGHVYQRGGWAAVDAIYDSPPRSTLEVLYPERYGEFEVADVDVEDPADRVDPARDGTTRRGDAVTRGEDGADGNSSDAGGDGADGESDGTDGESDGADGESAGADPNDGDEAAGDETSGDETTADETASDETADGTAASDWRRIRPTDEPDRDVIGPGAMAGALLAPTFEGVPDPIYQADTIRRGERPAAPGDDRYDFQLDAVEGWEGDRLHAYEDDAGRTGAVWRSRWTTAADAQRFRSRYADLLEIRGAEPADGYQGTYRFDDGSDYDGAVYLQVDGTDVVVVHGPDVQSLRALHDGAAPSFEGGFLEGVRSGPDDNALDRLPGGTALSALLALLAATVAVLAWERRST